MKLVMTLQRDQQAEKELQEKSKWVRGILKNIGLNTDTWPENLSMNDIRKLRADLKALDIDIIDDTDNGIEIYYQGEMIAEWRRPFYVLREKPGEKNPKYRYYLEMHINCRSVFEQQEEKLSNGS